MQSVTRIVFIAALIFLLDAGSKEWAVAHLTPIPLAVIPNFFYMMLASNPGGSLGMGSAFMEIAICMPAAMIMIVFAWIVRQVKNGRSLTMPQQIGFALLIGGTLGNWSERVNVGAVTDFCFFTFFNIGIFNVADVAIDIGFFMLVIEAVRQIRSSRGALVAATTERDAG